MTSRRKVRANMKSRLFLSSTLVVGLSLLVALVNPLLVRADPLPPFSWESNDASGLPTFGVYDTDNLTVLSTGDLAQLIWAGLNGTIDPPRCDGMPGSDDQLLDTNIVQNTGSLPPFLQNKGYILRKDYPLDSADPHLGGVIYIRAWNASTTTAASAYGDSATATLTPGGTYNAPRWYTNHVFPTAAWNGPSGGNWQTSGNWSTGTVPDCQTYVTIPASANLQLSANAAARSLTISSGAVLNFGQFDLTVEDTLTNNGRLRQTKTVNSSCTDVNPCRLLYIRNSTGTVAKYYGVDFVPTGGDLNMGNTALELRGNQTCGTSQTLPATVQRCYDITPTNPRAATLTFYYRPSEANGNVAPQVWHYIGGNNWSMETFAQRGGSGDAQFVQVSGVDSYSPFALKDDQPTAITLRAFSATADVNTWGWIGLGLLCTSMVGLGIYRFKRR
jgi:hypothetical protein